MITPATTSHIAHSANANFRTIKAWLVVCLFSVICPNVMAAAAPDWFQTIASNCEAGVTQDCVNAAIALKKGELNGKKIKKDPAKAKYFTDKAVRSGEKNCKQGDSLDCYTIGLLHFEGGGIIPANIPRGLDFLQRSCRAGYKKACEWLDNSGLR